MNKVVISGTATTNATKIIDYRQANMDFFVLKQNNSEFLVGIDRFISGGIICENNYLINGKLNKIFTGDGYLQFIEAQKVEQTENNKLVNKIVADADLKKCTIISGNRSYLQVAISGHTFECEYPRAFMLENSITIIGQISPSELDKNGNMGYIIKANKIVERYDEQTNEY